MAKTRARFYGRYSSVGQNEESIEQQFEACQAYAEREGYVVTGTYADKALTGKEATRRVEFMRMLRDAEKGLFDVLLVWKMDRFARNREDSAIFKGLLKRAGVRVISVMEYIPAGAEGILLESMLDGYAEYFSYNLAENVRRGKNKAAKKAQFTGGRVPFGFKVVDKKLAIDEARAPIVREAFERLAKGETRKAIWDSFNARGVVTQKGTPFKRGTLDSIFRNEKYIGIYTYTTDEGEEIRIEGGCPAIVPREIWDMIHGSKDAHKRVMRKGLYPLSSITRCAFCGTPYHGGEHSPRRDTAYFYYIHQKHLPSDKACTGRRYVNAKMLENAVVELIKSTVLRSDTIEQIVSKAMELQAEEKKDDTDLLKSELEQVKFELENIYDAIGKGLFSEGLQARFERLEARRAALVDALEAKGDEQRNKLSPDDIRAFLQGFSNGDFEDAEFQKELLRHFVRKIIIEPDCATVFLNYAPSDEGQVLLEFGDFVKASSRFSNTEKGLAFTISLPKKSVSQ